MARGRKTGGRQKGARNRATEEARVAAQATGILPLQHMLAVMRDPAADPKAVMLRHVQRTRRPLSRARSRSIAATPTDAPSAMAETRLASLKAVEPKLQAFYDSLDAKQKKAFDTGERVGGILDWWRKK